MSKRFTGGINENEYSRIHYWLKKNYGSANKCENPDCSHQSLCFQWAKIKGKMYQKDRNSFFMLCKSCHVAYDVTDETRKTKSEQMTGKNNHRYGVSVTGSAHPFYGRSHSVESRKLMSSHHRKISDSDLDDLRTLKQLGVRQNILAKDFGLSVASVSRIVNGKRYIL